MSKARTIRFEEPLDSLVDKYSKKNRLKINQLVTIAVQKFITEPNSIELEPVHSNSKSWNENMKKSFKKNKKAMDELA